MRYLALLRHGETACNRQNHYCGHCWAPLTSASVHKVATLRAWAKQLPPRHVLVSSLPRARQTAKLLLPHHPHMVCPELAELRFGDWEHQTAAQIQQHSPAHFAAWQHSASVSPPGQGESAIQVAERSSNAVMAQYLALPLRPMMLVISHKSTIRLLASCLLGIPLDRFRKFCQLPPLGLMVLQQPHPLAMWRLLFLGTPKQFGLPAKSQPIDVAWRG